MTDKSIEALLEIARAATPGEWQWDAGVIPPDGPGTYADIYVDENVERNPEGPYPDIKILAHFNNQIPEGCANAKFIATFNPAYVTSLIERAQAAEAQAELAGGIAERLAIERNDLRRQRDDLHEANNGYLARARTAEEALKPALLVLCAMPQDNLNAAFREDIDHAIKAIRALSPTRTEGDQTLSENTKKEA